MLRADGQWRATRGSYLFPVKALSRHFRGTMVRTLRQAAEAGQLDRITRPGEIDTMLRELMASEWVVYAKPCLSHEASAIEYLALSGEAPTTPPATNAPAPPLTGMPCAACGLGWYHQGAALAADERMP